MRGTEIAATPEPPYWAVLFSSHLEPSSTGYQRMAERMLELAAGQPGFLGVESAREGSGFGLTVSYWDSEEAIVAWRSHAEHQVAQESGRKTWYRDYFVRVARVERNYGP